MQQPSAPSDVVRAFFEAFQSRDEARARALLADDFTFSSPRDDRIDTAAYFERCWPHAARLRSIDFENLVEDGSDVFVRYVGKRTADGGKFRNTERIRVENGKVLSVEVYFGRDLPRAQWSSPFVETSPPEGDAQRAIRVLTEGLVEAVSRRDLEGALAPYAEDTTSFDLAPPLRTKGNPSDRRDAVRAWFDSWESDFSLTVSELEVAADGAIGFAHGLLRMAGTKKTGAAIDLHYRVTFGYENVKGEWKIRHVHESVPFDARTQRACLDLRP